MPLPPDIKKKEVTSKESLAICIKANWGSERVPIGDGGLTGVFFGN